MITLYSKPNCPHCVQAKSFFDSHGIAYTPVDITADAAAREFVIGRGHKTVPQIYVGESLLVEGGNAGLQKLSPDEVRTRAAALTERA